MAAPAFLPWLIGGAVVVGGVIALSKSSSKTAPRTDKGVARKPEREPKGQTPWETNWLEGSPCRPHPDSVFGSYDEDGECVEFWSQAHEDAFIAHAFDVYDEMGIPDMCEEFVVVYEMPGETAYNLLTDEWDYLLREVLSRTYGVSSSAWPKEKSPYEPAPEPPYAISKTWEMGRLLIREHLCGYEPIT